MRVHRLGDRALLLECAPEEVPAYLAAVGRAVETGEWSDVVDVVPAARTVLVRYGFDAGLHVAALSALVPVESATPGGSRHVDIDVVYDGDDLDDVAAETGLSRDDAVALHAGATYTVAFCGFAPGFAYLSGLDPRLVVGRLPSPRTRVPAGAVGLASGYTAVYPRESPGGWRLVGRTSADLFNPWRSPPALLTPGSTVRFRPVDELPEPSPAPRAREGVAAGEPAIEVLSTGGPALIQDAGRPGLGAIAVGASGAFDRAAHRLVNRLLGNDEPEAVIELLGGGLAMRALRPCTLAVAGAEGPVTVNGVGAARHAPVHLRSGDVVEVGPPASGLRAYVGLRGGIVVPRVLGSASTDTLAGLGPDQVHGGDVLAIGVPGPMPCVDVAPTPGHSSPLDLRVIAGPRWDWFTPAAHSALMHATYTVSPRSDRVGVRLDGEPLVREARRVGQELPPEGMVRGALQVPPDGRPVMLGPDHPVTGGYPVIAAVVDADLDAVAQAAPGTPVRFRRIG